MPLSFRCLPCSNGIQNSIHTLFCFVDNYVSFSHFKMLYFLYLTLLRSSFKNCVCKVLQFKYAWLVGGGGGVFGVISQGVFAQRTNESPMEVLKRDSLFRKLVPE